MSPGMASHRNSLRHDWYWQPLIFGNKLCEIGRRITLTFQQKNRKVLYILTKCYVIAEWCWKKSVNCANEVVISYCYPFIHSYPTVFPGTGYLLYNKRPSLISLWELLAHFVIDWKELLSVLSVITISESNTTDTINTYARYLINCWMNAFLGSYWKVWVSYCSSSLHVS
jgi:hypothetical protein